MPIKIELSLIPALAQVAAGDRALVVHGSSARLVPADAVLGSSGQNLIAGEDGNFYTPSVVVDNGVASLKLTVVV